MTLHNRALNPFAKNNDTGYGGSATPARATGLTGLPRTTGVVSTAGGFIRTPTVVCAPDEVLAISFYTKNSTASTMFGRIVYAGYALSGGGEAYPQTFTTTVLNAGESARMTFVPSPAPANTVGMFLIYDSLPGAGIVMNAVMLDPSGVINPYADGDSTGWTWDGVNGDSSSSELDAGPGFKLWNGSAEVPVTVTLWNGTAEVAVSLDSIV